MFQEGQPPSGPIKKLEIQNTKKILSKKDSKIKSILHDRKFVSPSGIFSYWPALYPILAPLTVKRGKPVRKVAALTNFSSWCPPISLNLRHY